jgi:mannose-6-phosphate isomerase class I
VTRRLYRAGESKHWIDGHACRLSDIHELLMDTGLGAKTYAIIEQGKIGMILSSRPTDRRQLIEEAAGITKYKARRRAAELKLDAAQQNLTRIDDIVYEVEKQRGSLKRQAAKARRYTRLRDEMRRWEKVLFARRYRSLGETIESTRARLADTREQETAAAARLAEVENELARVRIELAEAETTAARVRDQVHTRELEINRRQQQIALDTQQAEMLRTRREELAAERATLEARREPERVRLEERRQAAAEAARAREEAAALAASAGAEQAQAQQAIEVAERDVEQARGELYAVMNTVTALTAALQSATAQRERAEEALGRLQVEATDLQTEHDRAVAAHAAAADALTTVQESLDGIRLQRITRESELATARNEHEWRAREVRTREHDLAALTARLRSLEELDAHRAGFSDAARMVLVEANGHVGQMGALADFIEVDPRYERAVEAHLGEGLMSSSSSDIDREISTLVDQAKSKGSDFASGGVASTSGEKLSELVTRLHGEFGSDIGIFVLFFLNFVTLQPGEALFLVADDIHAYVSGDIIECMAASDNVVRAGLTPKFKDTDTLVSMLTYNFAPIEEQKMVPTEYPYATINRNGYSAGSTVDLYDPPIEEFSVVRTALKGGEGSKVTFEPLAGPSIIICTGGRGRISVGPKTEEFKEGHVFFVGATAECVLQAEGGKESEFVTFKAFCEIDDSDSKERL